MTKVTSVKMQNKDIEVFDIILETLASTKEVKKMKSRGNIYTNRQILKCQAF